MSKIRCITRLAVALHKLRLVVPEIEMRRRSGEVEIDDALRLRRKVRLLRPEGIWQARHGGAGVVRQELAQGETAKAELAVLQEVPPGLELQSFVVEVHRFINISSRFKRTLPTTVRAARSA